jgi:hypothetical protein
VPTLPTYTEEPPAPLLHYLESGVHTGRGTGHLNALTDAIVPALAKHPLIAPFVDVGQIAYFAGARQGKRGIDLQFGKPNSRSTVFDSTVGMLAGEIETVMIAGFYTSIMTEHAKAQGNRLGDFEKFVSKTRRAYGDDVVRFAVCPVNAADKYFSHTGHGINEHGSGPAKAARAIDILRRMPLRVDPRDPDGVDAMWTPVVVTNNAIDDDKRVVSWLRQYPQPADGAELSFGWFIDTIATACDTRFSH